MITNAQSLFSFFLGILNLYVVPIIFAIAFVMFLFGVYRYFIAGGANAEKVQEGQKFVMWSVVGFVIMFSIWGIINLFINTLGFDSTSRPGLPTFGSSSVSPSGSINTSSFPNILNNANSAYQSGGFSAPSSSGTVCSDGSVAANGVCNSCANGMTSANACIGNTNQNSNSTCADGSTKQLGVPCPSSGTTVTNTTGNQTCTDGSTGPDCFACPNGGTSADSSCASNTTNTNGATVCPDGSIKQIGVPCPNTATQTTNTTGNQTCGDGTTGPDCYACSTGTSADPSCPNN